VLFPVSEITGGSSIYASVEDLNRWDIAVAEGVAGRGRVARLLARPTVASGDTIPYVFGIRRQAHRGLATLERGGHVPGGRAEFVHFPEQRFGVAAMCNAEHLYPGMLARKVADLYLADVMQPPRQLPIVLDEVPVSVAELERYAGYYRSPDAADFARFTIIDGKLAELLRDTTQTMTYRGGGQFTGDGSPGDFRLLFTETPATGTIRLQYLVEGDVDGAAERIPDAEVWRPNAAVMASHTGHILQ
jgi:hypothetical protein